MGQLSCLAPALRDQLSHPHMHISARPLCLRELLHDCDLVLCEGGFGTVHAALLAGVPLLLFPTQGEQRLLVRRLETLGVAKVVEEEPGSIDYPSLLEQLLSHDTLRAAARSFAVRHADYDPTRVAERIAAEIAGLVGG